MSNDFIEGMEILMRCKHHIETKLRVLYKQKDRYIKYGRDISGLQQEIARCEYCLGYRNNMFDVEED